VPKHHAYKAQRGNGGKTPHILNLATMYWQMVRRVFGTHWPGGWDCPTAGLGMMVKKNSWPWQKLKFSNPAILFSYPSSIWLNFKFGIFLQELNRTIKSLSQSNWCPIQQTPSTYGTPPEYKLEVTSFEPIYSMIRRRNQEICEQCKHTDCSWHSTGCTITKYLQNKLIHKLHNTVTDSPVDIFTDEITNNSND
jgi:hypothetical protein